MVFVLPEGNLLLMGVANGGSSDRFTSLGPFFARLDDELLLDVLGLLGASAVLQLAQTSLYFHVFAGSESVWKTLMEHEAESNPRALLLLPSSGGGADTQALAEPSPDDGDALPVRWLSGSWRASYARLVGGRAAATAADTLSLLDRRKVFSDYLFRLDRICGQDYPACLEEVLRAGRPATRTTPAPAVRPLSAVDRWSAADLPVSKFVELYEERNVPVLVSGHPFLQLPAATTSSPAAWLAQEYGAAPMRCRGLSMPLAEFVAYAAENHEEMPLYLFDREFARKLPALAAAYRAPDYFADDLFELLEPADRPDYRWLICGGLRSGSVFHIDPNQTSAFNAVLEGRKYFLLFPPNAVPPGVLTDERRENVTVPLSIWEWFEKFFSFAAESRAGALQCVVEPGDVLFIPQGWWHCALNLSPMCVAVTQNFCSPRSLPAVLQFLNDKPDQISGVAPDAGAAFRRKFISALQQHRPELLATSSSCASSPPSLTNRNPSSGLRKRKAKPALFPSRSSTQATSQDAVPFRFLSN